MNSFILALFFVLLALSFAFHHTLINENQLQPDHYEIHAVCKRPATEPINWLKPRLNIHMNIFKLS
ncbi:hypothetical protein GGR10_000691 [Bartonella chomelii]|uniref:Uncharacterized protein n=1 Tax=Bartonella chomelii TaxID=236402 RepID=A0ABR6E2R2_9HYPH|nr:hypothetical protein [Bartonella chomelii]